MSSVNFGVPRPKTYRVAPEEGKGPPCAPSFLERPESLLTVGRGEEIRLSCVVQGEPTPRGGYASLGGYVTHSIELGWVTKRSSDRSSGGWLS